MMQLEDVVVSGVTEFVRIYIILEYFKIFLNVHFSMSNLYDGSINKIDGHIISKKDDKDNHGYGLYSIKRIVDKYDGSMIKSYENGQFEVDIIIYLE